MFTGFLGQLLVLRYQLYTAFMVIACCGIIIAFFSLRIKRVLYTGIALIVLSIIAATSLFYLEKSPTGIAIIHKQPKWLSGYFIQQ